MLKFIFAAVIICGALLNIQAQSRLAQGQWADHFSYNQVKSLTTGANKIFAAGDIGIIVYNQNDNSIETIGRVDGLSDTKIAVIDYDNHTQTLIVAYENGNIDLVRDDEIINAPHIITKGLVGSTAINGITVLENGRAYFATDFGIVLLDLENGLSLDSYIFRNSEITLGVFDVAIFRDTVFAATDKGLWKVPANNPNILLADFRNWKRDTTFSNGIIDKTFNQIDVFQEQLIVNFSAESSDPGGSVSDSLFYGSSGAWNYLPAFTFGTRKIKSFGDRLLVGRVFGFNLYDQNLSELQFFQDFNVVANDVFLQGNKILVGTDKDGAVEINAQNEISPLPKIGPAFNNSFRLSASPDDALFVAGGGVSPNNNNVFSNNGFYRYVNGLWENYNRNSREDIPDTLVDVLQIAATTANNFYVGSWGDGLLEFKGDQLSQVYFSNNSPLSVRPEFNSQVNSGFIKLDASGNLWVSNSYTENLLKVLKADGSWVSIDLGNAYGSRESAVVMDMEHTSNNQVWMVRAQNGARNGIFVMQYGDNLEDPSQYQFIGLTENPENGNLPNITVKDIAEDLDGDIWVATSTGPAVFYNPELLFEEGSDQAQQIFIEQDGNVQIVLETEQVNCIAIDGGNRKWFGTQSSGIFVFSPDGSEQVLQFTSDNSPLLSNEITDLEILPLSGEVFISSGLGIQSYRSNATDGKQEISELNVYPNPVRPNFTGSVVMDGFVRDTQLKITDTSGRLVRELTSLGGRASWDLQDFSGLNVGNGVYLILATNEDGSQRVVDRVLVVRN